MKESPTTNADAASAGLPARRGALEVLERVSRGQTLDEAMAASRAFGELEGRDRAFARAIASETLRRRGALDWLITPYFERPLPKRASRVVEILRMTAAQLLILETPAHAAVSTAVDLAGERKETAGYAKLINAIARKVAKSGRDALEAAPARADAPGWLWRAWERSYGPTGARAIVAAHRAPAPLDLTVKPGEDAADWAARLGGETLPTGSVRRPGVSDVAALEGYEGGAWWAQDAAAALPARLFGDIAGARVLDLCAAPGGKTMQLAAAGARVHALDISAKRLAILQGNLARTGLTAELIEADAREWTPQAPFDAVLLDAPCSSTGTIRRHPELPWIKSADDVAALVPLQKALLDRAGAMTAPGGALVYAVCSLQREEGEAQIKAFLERNRAFAIEPIEARALGLPERATTREGHLRTLPFLLAESGGMDGFFIARLRRDKSPS